jgi:hypothetical protein
VLPGVPAALAAQLGMDPRRAPAAPGPLVVSRDAHCQAGVLAVPVTGLPVPGGVVGGTGDLQQLADECPSKQVSQAHRSS